VKSRAEILQDRRAALVLWGVATMSLAFGVVHDLQFVASRGLSTSTPGETVANIPAFEPPNHLNAFPQDLSVTLTAEAKGPLSVLLHEKFPVGVYFHIASVAGQDGRLLDPKIVKLIEPSLLARLADLIMASLDLAGTQVRPEDPRPLAPDLSAHWSVDAESSGPFVGFIRTIVSHRGSDGFFLNQTPADIPIRVEFTKAPVGFGDILGFSATAVGLVGGLGGLLALGWQAADRRTKKRADNAGKEPTIYTPDGSTTRPKKV